LPLLIFCSLLSPPPSTALFFSLLSLFFEAPRPLLLLPSFALFPTPAPLISSRLAPLEKLSHSRRCFRSRKKHKLKARDGLIQKKAWSPLARRSALQPPPRGRRRQGRADRRREQEDGAGRRAAAGGEAGKEEEEEGERVDGIVVFFSLHFLDLLLLLSSTLSTHFSTSPSSPSRPPLHSPPSNQTTTDLRPRDALPRHGQPGRDRPERLRRPLVLLGGRGRRRRRRRRRRGREEAAGREGRGALLLEVEHHWAAPRSQVRERKNQNCNKHNELHSEKKEDKRERRCYNIKIKKSPSVF